MTIRGWDNDGERDAVAAADLAERLVEVRVALAAGLTPGPDLDARARRGVNRVLAEAMEEEEEERRAERREEGRLTAAWVAALRAAGARPGGEWGVAAAAELALDTVVKSGARGPRAWSGRRGRRAWGTYYTPQGMARWLATETLGPLAGGSEPLAVVDPACGAGVLLLAAVDVLADAGAPPGLVAGVDVDEGAAELARLLVRCRCHARGWPSEVRIVAGDALEAAGPFRWSEAFPDQAPPGGAGFDAVVANPPFLAEVRGQAARFAALRRSPRVGRHYRPKTDLAYLFAALSLDLTRPAGRAGLVLGDYWAGRSGAAGFRATLAGGARVCSCVSVGDEAAFAAAPGCHDGLLVLEKSPPAPDRPFTLARGEPWAGTARMGPGVAVAVGDRLELLFEDEAALLRAVRARGTARLGRRDCSQGIIAPQTRRSDDGASWRGGRASRGIFVLSADEVAAMGFSAQERALLRPYYWARQLRPFRVVGPPGGLLLYLDRAARAALERSPADFERVRAHLLANRGVITGDGAPFGLHRARTPEWFEGAERVLGARKAVEPCFAVASEPSYVGEACVVVRPPAWCPAAALVALLNSAPLHFAMRVAKRHGTMLQVDLDVLTSLPLLRPSEEEAAALTAAAASCSAEHGAPSARRALDALVCRCYGLGPDAEALLLRAFGRADG